MKKRIGLLMLALCLALSLFAAAACEKTYTITVEQTANGTVKASAAQARGGEEITLTVTPAQGYKLEQLTVNGEAISGTKFKMPEKDVTVKATFAAETPEQPTYTAEPLPAETAFAVTAKSVNKDAVSTWTAVFGADGITVTAYVEDSVLVDGKDGVKLYIGTETRSGVLTADGQYAVYAYSDKTVKVYAANADGAMEECSDADVTAKLTAAVTDWSRDGQTLTGYKVVITAEYALVGLTAADAKDKITVLPVIMNGNSTSAAIGATEKTMGDSVQTQPNTYLVLVDDNQYRASAYSQANAQLGGTSALSAGSYWDLSKDYYADDERYADRIVTLTGHDKADNNLLFYRASGSTMYAEATVKLTSITDSEEKYGKFGMMMFDGATQKGVFFYVDAAVGETAAKELQNINNTYGYNVAVNGWGSWAGLNTAQRFSKETFTAKLAMLYQDDIVYMYANDVLVGTAGYVCTGQPNFGFKSFGFGMEITDYYATADVNDPVLQEHMITYTKQDVEALFAGDSYMDLWKSNGFAQHTAAIAAADKANEGIGGTQINQWTAKAALLSKMYNPDNIVFHIGVNDIDDGNTTGQTAYDRLVTMLEAYHEAFPEAQLYWVSLVPNTMFPAKAAEYTAMNTLVKELAENQTYLTYIDVTTAFTAEGGGARVNMFYDGLHFNQEYGYPLWSSIIMNALGHNRVTGSAMGDNQSGYAYSSGWDVSADNGTAAAKVTSDYQGEQVIYYSGVQSSANLYFETELYSPSKSTQQNPAGDAWTKVGLMLRNDSYTVMAYLDVPDSTAAANRKWANIVYRPNTTGASAHTADWQWNSQPAGGDSGALIESGFVKLAVAKAGDTVYMLVNGRIVAQTTIPGMTADMKFVAGIIGFNRKMEAQNYTGITGTADAIKTKIGLIAENAVIDGIIDDAIYTETVIGNTLSFGDKGDGRHFEVAAVKGTDGVYFAVTIYSNENTKSGNLWHQNANIEFRFGNDMATQRYIYFQGAGLGDNVRGSAGVIPACSSSELQDGGLYKTVVEFFTPYAYFSGYSAADDEISLKVWGWVFDAEGWRDVMNTGTWANLTVSENGLRFERQVNVLEPGEAATVTTDLTTARKGDVVTISVEVNDGYQLEKVMVDGVEITAKEGVYSFVMPDKNVAVSATFSGAVSVTVAEGIADKVSVNKTVAKEGEKVTVTFNGADGFVLTALAVNGTSIFVEGQTEYEITVQGGATEVAVTGSYDYDTEGFIIDGAGEEYNAETIVATEVEGGRDFFVTAKKGAYGVYIYSVAHTTTNVDTAAQWFMNHNFEFYLNNGPQSYVNNKRETNNVTKFFYSVELQDSGDYAGMYEHIVEIFVHKSLIKDFGAAADVRLNYAWKAPGEVVRVYDGLSCRWDRTDWWNNAIGGADKNGMTSLTASGLPDNLYIDEDGLVIDRAKAADAVIDGTLGAEYEGKASVTLGDENKAKVTITGFRGTNGVYLAFTILHKGISESAADWAANDNLELKINDVDCAVSIIDGKIVKSGTVTEAAMTRTGEAGSYTTIIEMFIADGNTALTNYSFQLGVAGTGFGGWQALVWDDTMGTVMADGVYVNYDWAAAEGITLDGVLTDTAYTDAVKAAEFTATRNGADFKMIGVKMKHGILLGITVTHTKPASEKVQGGENNDWWCYLGAEMRVGNNLGQQVFATPWSNNRVRRCVAGIATVGESAPYTTTFEIYVPYGHMQNWDVSGDIRIGVAFVVETGFTEVFGNFSANSSYYVTSNGIVTK